MDLCFMFSSSFTLSLSLTVENDRAACYSPCSLLKCPHPRVFPEFLKLSHSPAQTSVFDGGPPFYEIRFASQAPSCFPSMSVHVYSLLPFPSSLNLVFSHSPHSHLYGESAIRLGWTHQNQQMSIKSPLITRPSNLRVLPFSLLLSRVSSSPLSHPIIISRFPPSPPSDSSLFR